MHSLKTKFALLALLLFLFGLVSLAALPRHSPPPTSLPQSGMHLSDAIRAGTAPRPAFSTSTRERLANGHAAKALLSYTDTGFEPREVSVKVGDTVRFTNNSSHSIWIAATSSAGPLYPSAINGCGSSELDSCGAIRPQDFWEFTFDAKGTWGVANTLDPAGIAVVRVR